MIYVQFTDSSKTKVTSVFSCPQDPESYPNQGELNENDDRYRAFYVGMPVEIRQYMVTPVDNIADVKSA